MLRRYMTLFALLAVALGSALGCIRGSGGGPERIDRVEPTATSVSIGSPAPQPAIVPGQTETFAVTQTSAAPAATPTQTPSVATQTPTTPTATRPPTAPAATPTQTPSVATQTPTTPPATRSPTVPDATPTQKPSVATQTPATPPATRPPTVPDATPTQTPSVATQTPTTPPATRSPTVPDATPTQTPSVATQTPATPPATRPPTVPPATQVPTTPPATQTPTPAPLPDLVIEIAVRLKPNPRIEWGDSCIFSSSSNLPFHVGEITAHVRNIGGGDAGSFTVRLNNAVTETVDGLKAGSNTTLVVSTRLRSENVAVVDAGSSIDESDESNNTAETFMPVPTLVPPAPTCTPKSR